ncbi:MAG TPA: HAD hydrolase family protein [Kiritimatiellia bacterium]|nr:HAD hydrolase family protein [Kiritimatiellia bacterium]
MEIESETVSAVQGIRMISLDFDGTILSYDDPAGVFHPAIINVLNALPAHGVRWCANSGREFDDQLAVLERSRKRGLDHLPDALICSESMVYYRDGASYHPLQPWNNAAESYLRDCHRRVQDRLTDRLDYIVNTYQPVTSMIGDLYTAFLLRDHGSQPAKLFLELQRFLDGMEDIMLTRNGGWVAVMHRELGKGNALLEYARHARLTPEHLLAIGDHYNDLPMLTPRVARHLGCPGDAIPEVRQAVSKAGGRIAEASGPQGTAEVIQSLVFG